MEAMTTGTQRHLRRLDVMWAERPGLLGWVTTTDHKRIGLLYLVASLGFFAAGGIEALLIRTQLIKPESGLRPEAYNQVMTCTGSR
jgi:cytochrome c oxidase subunit I+III